MHAAHAKSAWKTVAAFVGVVTCCCLSFPAQVSAMVYRPESGAMWDPSILWHDGTYYAFMMYCKDGANGLDAKHCLLASSADGVHWRTEGIVNEELEAAAGNKFFKCFVGRCGDRFIMDHGVRALKDRTCFGSTSPPI